MSQLNELLLALEKETLGISGRDVNHKRVAELSRDIGKLMSDEDYEVCESDLRFLDNSTRRMIFSGFAIGLSSYNMAVGLATKAEELAGVGGGDEDDEPEPPKEDHDTILDKMLKQKPNGRN